MPRVPFVHTLTGGSDKYGTPFAAADDAFGSASELNGVLAAILAASQVPATYGITLPDATAKYRVTSVFVQSDDADDDVRFGMYNGATPVAPLGQIVNGTGTLDFGDGLTVQVGYIPFLETLAASGTVVLTGWIEWEKI